MGDEKVRARRPSWTGIDEPAKIGYHWVPYLIAHIVGGNSKIERTLPPIKINMQGLRLLTKREALEWMNKGVGATHPDLVGKHIEIVEEPTN